MNLPRHIRAVLLLTILIAAAPACASNRRESGPVDSDRRSISHAGWERTYRVRVPPGVTRTGNRVPLVLMLHGGGDNADNAERMINGLLDKAVPWNGGHSDGRFGSRAWDGTPMKPAVAQARYWASANRCAPTPKVTGHAGYSLHRWDCPGNTAVEIYQMADMGHAWPGGMRGTPGGDDPGDALNASEVIWEFFRSHPRR